MEWTKYTIHTTEAAEDLIGYMLSEMGIIGVEIEDKVPVTAAENGGYFGDVVPEPPENDHLAEISFYLKKSPGEGLVSEAYDPGTGPIARDGESESDRREREILQADPEEVLARVREGLAEIASYCDIGEGTITADVTGEEDWVNNWKNYFHQFSVSGVRIVPSWEEAGDGDEDVVLHIDPGTAFGTGAHESTQLAIAGLRKYLKPGDRVLDIGTGSGILGMLAAKLGASYVFATDLDPNVPAALEENLSKNEICRERFGFILGDIATNEAVKAAAGDGYDLVLANIIAEILAGITPAVPRHIKKGGVYVTSGILITHADLVREAMREADFTILEETTMGEWMSIAARKN